MKAKLMFLGMLFILLFGFITRTIGLCITINLGILVLYVLFKYSNRNNVYKHKINVAEDFLKHKYGEKMGEYIMKETLKKKNLGLTVISILCIGLLLSNFMTVPVSSALGDYTYGFENTTTTNQVLLSESGFFRTTTTASECYVDTDHPYSGSKCYQFDSNVGGNKIVYFYFDNMNISINNDVSFYAYIDKNDVLGGNTEIIYMQFYNESNTLIIDLTIKVRNDDEFWFYYDDHDSHEKLVAFLGDTHIKMGFDFIDKDSVNYYCNGTYELSTPKTVSDNYNITYLKVTTKSTWGQNPNDNFWIDDFTVAVSEAYDYGEEYNKLFFRIVDLESNTELGVHGHFSECATSGICPFPIPHENVRCTIYSDLWNGDYNTNMDFGSGLITLENLSIPQSGSWHYFNFSDIVGYVNGQYRLYTNSSNLLHVYPTQEFTIHISDSTYTSVTYTNVKHDTTANEPCMLASDKRMYTQGESVNFQYKVPTAQQLSKIWYLPTSYYYLWIYDVDNLGWLFQATDGGLSADNYAYRSNYAISLDGVEHYLQWNYDATEVSGYKTVTGGIDQYKAYIGHRGGGLFGADIILVGKLEFFIEGGIFTANGNITSVSPVSPELGQKATITFDVNNNGYMTVRNLLAPQETEIILTSFAKFTGSKQVNYTFWDFGEYKLDLYVSDGINYTSVDSTTVSVTTTNGSYGGFGYNVEFLTVEPARAIAGFDTIFINYRSLNSNGIILVNDSRGQQTPFSTQVGIKTGVLNISLPNYAEIGEWKITLKANSTLNTTFQVVAEENNWVEFGKNIFYPDEPFEIELKHDRKIEVVFYKDNVAYGSDWYLDTGLLPSGIYEVPRDKAFPEIGDWKVEIWQVNNFIKIQKLAQDTCKVIQRPSDVTLPEVSDELVDYLSNIDPFFKSLIGLFVVLLCTFLPMLAIKNVGEMGINIKVDIPPTLYTVCAGIGAIVSFTLGLWAIEYAFFICVMAGFGTFALYLIGKRGNGE